MLFNVDIDFNEYDLYTMELENKLNQKMMSLGYAIKGRINTQYDIILQYYKLEGRDNGYIEYNVSFTYYTRDLQNYILEKIELAKNEKVNDVINISNREEMMKILPKNEDLKNLYENGDLGGV
jgi:hypothetical protein